MRANIKRCFIQGTDEEGTLPVSDGSFFKPAKSKSDPLAGVGIKGKIASINGNVFVTEQEATQIAQALVHLSRSIAKNKVHDFLNNQRNLIPVELKLKGKTNWDSSISINARGILESTRWKTADHLAMPADHAVYFRCPSCTHVESSWCKPFQHTDLDIQIKCNGCHRKTKVLEWKCECDELWHRCPRHRENPETMSHTCTKLKTRKQNFEEASMPKKAKPPTQVGPDSHTWLLAQDEAKEKRKRDALDEWDGQAILVLGIPVKRELNPALLGPTLKRRFLDVKAPADIVA